MFGWLLFLCLTIADIGFLRAYGTFTDKVVLASTLICFQATLLFSSLYHTFCCRSAKHYVSFLSFDLFGIACSILAIYICGIVYAFWCRESLRNFYVITVVIMFVVAIILQLPALNVSENIKVMSFILWAAYGIVPCCHWYFELGGIENQMVQVSDFFIFKRHERKKIKTKNYLDLVKRLKLLQTFNKIGLYMRAPA